MVPRGPAEKRAELRVLYLASLTTSANISKKRPEPRRRMLAEAIRQDDVLEQVRKAKELVSLDPTNRDVHFVLAAEGLDGTTPNIPEIRRHLKVLEGETPRRARTEWVAARVADLTNDKPQLQAVLKKARPDAHLRRRPTRPDGRCSGSGPSTSRARRTSGPSPLRSTPSRGTRSPPRMNRRSPRPGSRGSAC